MAPTAIAFGSEITVSTSADNTAADDDITLREAVLLANGGTGPQGLGRPLRRDPNPDDGVPAGEERWVFTPAGASAPGFDRQDQIHIAVEGEIVLSSTPLVQIADGDGISFGRIRAQNGPVLEVRGTRNRLVGSIVGPTGDNNAALPVRGDENDFIVSVEDAGGPAVLIEGGEDNVVRVGTLARNGEGVRLTAGASRNRIDDLEVVSSIGDGIVITGGAHSNTVADCLVGTRFNAETGQYEPAGNGGHGILLTSGARFNTVSGTVVGGSGGTGILLTGEGTELNLLTRVFVGAVLNPQGYTSVGANAENGLVFSAGASHNLVEGRVSAFVANTGHGILITGTGTNGNVVRDQITVRANTADGVRIEGPDSRGNVVAADRIGGIDVFELPGPGPGPGMTFEFPLANLGNGVLIDNAPGNTVGSYFGAGNTIASNQLDGVHITGAAATGNRVAGNLIGTETGTSPAPNGLNGVAVTGGARGTTIGGVRPVFNPLVPSLPLAPDLGNLGGANLISGNSASGVRVSGAGVEGTNILGNLIGFSFGETPLGNGDGVTVSDGAQDTCIGDCLSLAERDPGFANIVADHAGAGVLVCGETTAGASIRRSSVARNTEDILLVGGANGGVQPPAITSVDFATGRLRGVAPGAGIVDVFTDVPGDEGAFHLAAFVPGGAFVLDPFGGATENALIFDSARPLRTGVLRMTFTESATENTSEFAAAR
jgi:hypothetical protein